MILIAVELASFQSRIKVVASFTNQPYELWVTRPKIG